MRLLDGITDAMKRELGQTLGDGKGQGGLACCSPWGCKELDVTQSLNDTSDGQIQRSGSECSPKRQKTLKN